VDAPLIGTVLNGVTAEGAYGYSYRYAYSQGEGPKKKNGGTTKKRRDHEAKAAGAAPLSVPGPKGPEA
jgi:hypothetical protein